MTGRREREGPEGRDVLARALDRMAHQIRNPLQAVSANLEVVRTRMAKEAPESWGSLERFARAMDSNVDLLDRRLRLLLALGRRSDGAVSEVDVAGVARDFAAALGCDEGPPGVRVRGGSGVAARARPGWLLTLLFALWEAAAEAGAEESPFNVRDRAGEVSATMPLPLAALEVGDGSPRLAPEWEEAAERAGGELRLEEADGAWRIGLVLPSR